MDFSDKRYHFTTGTHRDAEVIWVEFEKNNELIAHLREHTKARWSASQKKWHVPNNRHYRALFGLPEEITGKTVLSKFISLICLNLSGFRSILF